MKAQFASRAQELFQRLQTNEEAEIDQLIADAQLEAYFLDFKTAERHRGRSLGNDDRNNLAKALSGFANSEGGVLLWGVSTVKGTDVAGTKQPLDDPARFASQLLAAVGGLTVPPAEGVEAHHFAAKGESGKGYVAVWIPKGVTGPIQITQSGRYYIRAANSFEPAPHGVVAGMFGRSPQPKVIHRFTACPARPVLHDEKMTAYLVVQVLLSNVGPVVAEGLYASFSLTSLAEGSIAAHLTATEVSGNTWRNPQDAPPERRWSQSNATINDLSLVACQDYRVAPRGHAQAFVLHLWFSPDAAGDFSFEVASGCSGTPPVIQLYRVDQSRLREVVQAVIATASDPEDSDVEAMHKAAAQLLGLEPDSPQFEGVPR